MKLSLEDPSFAEGEGRGKSKGGVPSTARPVTHSDSVLTGSAMCSARLSDSPA